MKPKELTIRGLILGELITTSFTAANVYLGLRAEVLKVGSGTRETKDETMARCARLRGDHRLALLVDDPTIESGKITINEAQNAQLCV